MLGYGCLNFSSLYCGHKCHEAFFLPVIQLPIVDNFYDHLILLVAGLALRMKQLARTSQSLLGLVHDREFVFKLVQI